MRVLILFFVGLLLTLSGRAQERVRNVGVRVIDSSQLEIRYDLINARPGDSVYFDVRSRLRGALRILPEFVRGDVGKGILAGSDRRIIWNALANGYALQEEIRATVLVKTGGIPVPLPTGPALADRPGAVTSKPDAVPTTPAEPAPTTERQPEKPAQPPTTQPQPSPTAQPLPPSAQTIPATPTPRPDSAAFWRTRYAGPAWALLSAVAPGIGNSFVQTPTPRLGFRPIVLIGCYGLFVYGLRERQQARDTYAVYEVQKNRTAAAPYYQTANDHHHRYYIATRAAVVVAAADVILTFMKGLRNNRIQKEARQLRAVTARPGLQAGQPTAVVRYSF